MTGLPSRSPRPSLGHPPAPMLTVALTVGLVAVLLVVLAAGAPAAALRSGPDVAVAPGVDVRPVAVDRAWSPAPSAGETRAGDGARATGYVPPVAGVDPPSGVVRQFDPPEEEWGAGHRGVDLVASEGSRVMSPGPGVVTFAGLVAGRGVVVITHPDGLRTSLEPVAASVPVGTAVATGTPIGVVEGGSAGGGGGDGGHDGGEGVGASHCAPRSCVHWGVRRGERYIDPLSLLDRPPIVLLPDH